MVFLSVEFHEFCFNTGTYAAKYLLQIFKNLFGKNTTTIFCYEYQMYIQYKNTMFSILNIVDFFHEQSILNT